MSVTNQLVININKPDYSERFKTTNDPYLQVGIDEWQKAWRDIKRPTEFILYLYLAGNADGFTLELSQRAFENATGISKSSYHRGVNKLKELGYIYEDVNGRLCFSPSPKSGSRIQIHEWEMENSSVDKPSSRSETAKSHERNSEVSQKNRETNKKDYINSNKKIDKPSSDYSYLDELLNYDDGSYMWNGSIHFIDGNILQFYDWPREKQASQMKLNTPFKSEEIEYILSKMEDNTYE